MPQRRQLKSDTRESCVGSAETYRGFNLFAYCEESDGRWHGHASEIDGDVYFEVWGMAGEYQAIEALKELIDDCAGDERQDQPA